MRKLTLGLIAGAAVLAMAVGPAAGDSGTNLAAKAKVKASDFDFSPQKVNIGKGDKVIWKNVQGEHTVTFKGGSNFNKVINGNDRVSKKFKNKGKFKYICRFHKAEEMKGKVVVG
jgi:plastocyanin